MSFVLPVDVYSPDQLSELMLELQDAAAAARDTAARSKSGTTTDEPRTLSPNLEQLLTQNKVSQTDTAALETLAKSVEMVLEKAPTIHILLAASPTRAMKRQLVSWFRTEIHELSLVTFAARRDLGGGIIVQVGSHLYDLSFRRSIIDNRARLTELAGV